MANKKTRALTDDEFAQIIQTIQHGYITADGKKIKPNIRVSVALTLQANLEAKGSGIL